VQAADRLPLQVRLPNQATNTLSPRERVPAKERESERQALAEHSLRGDNALARSRSTTHLTWQVDAEAEEAGTWRPSRGSQRAGQKTRPRLDYEERRRRVGPARAPRCGQVSISRTILLHMAGKMSPACPPELPHPRPQPRFT